MYAYKRIGMIYIQLLCILIILSTTTVLLVVLEAKKKKPNKPHNMYNYGYHTNYENPPKFLSSLGLFWSFLGETFNLIGFPSDCHKSGAKLLILTSWKPGPSFDIIPIAQLWGYLRPMPAFKVAGDFEHRHWTPPHTPAPFVSLCKLIAAQW